MQARPTPASTGRDPAALPLFMLVLRPLVDVVAGARVGVHPKLLVAFLLGALLLVASAALSLSVAMRMNDQSVELRRLQARVDRTRQMTYLVTAQSHYRAMALLTGDAQNTERVDAAKRDFTTHLAVVEQLSPGDQRAIFARLRGLETRFAGAGLRVQALAQAGDTAQALQLHLNEEHPISHDIEAALAELQLITERDVAQANAAIEQGRDLLTRLVGGFALLGLALMILAGLVFSWAFVRPLRAVAAAVERIAGGDVHHRVRVLNRDEFGAVAGHVNTIGERLAALQAEARALEAHVQALAREQSAQQERTSELKRYLSPQLAEAIMSGRAEVSVRSRRELLTIFFSDIRGFTSLSERMEPEDLVDLMNQYFEAMTRVVFKHGGTLDKYIGDAIMVFFGDPIPYEDHAERAVRMALEMRERLHPLRERWRAEKGVELHIGMGLSTGYVTVGNIGSAARLEYTVFGNHVNLASRLADQAGPNQILVSERTLAAVRGLVAARQVDEIELEGVSRPIKVFEIDPMDAVGVTEEISPELVWARNELEQAIRQLPQKAGGAPTAEQLQAIVAAANDLLAAGGAYTADQARVVRLARSALAERPARSAAPRERP